MRKLHNQKGQAMVEMALVLPLLLLLVFGIIEFGRIFNAYLVVNNASREGARYAAVGKAYSDITPEINNLTSTLGTVTVEFTPSNGDDREEGKSVQVKISHTLPLITPIVGPLISGDDELVIEASTTMRVE